jgi:hypothetical protein
MSMDTEIFDESDGALNDAVAKITAKLTGGQAPAKEDTRKNSANADATEYDGSTDLEQLEGEAADAKAGEDQTAEKTEPDGEDGAKADAEGDEIFELPAEKEGDEPVKMTKAEAIAAIRAQRQIQGDIANVINQAEAKYQQEQDTIIDEIAKAHDVVITRAEAALKMMPRPLMPSEALLDVNSQYYNPEQYHLQKINYDRQVDVIKQVQQAHADASKQKAEALTVADQIQNSREHERLSRVKGWEDWKDSAKRETRATALIKDAEEVLGIPPEVLAKMPFHHKLMVNLDKLIKAEKAPVKAVEVKKAIQEKAPKMVNGQAPTPPRAKNGQFINEARKELRDTGSTDAFANYLLKSGALKQR